MSSEGDTAARDPLDLLVEQFLAARRTDPKLAVEAFAAAHPEHAAGLRELLPTIVALEEHKRERASSGSGRRRAAVPQLERLGEFRIVREVGRGGMGVVFEAVQESLGRKVALKVLPQAALLTGNQLERFRREAQIAAQLHHSNIVPVFGSGESDGYHWYAMQFISGVSLDGWRDEQTAAPPTGSGAWKARARFVARLGVQAAEALHCAHGVGTLHRDIKPGNLLLEPNDHLWVTDFGLAKALEAEGLTHSGDLLGTLQYMAPEQFTGSYDVRSEVYALGVTLYELLTLRAAFAGSSRSELMERIRTLRPEPLRKLCPELPEDLAVVVEKAMARDPADRYRDAGLLATDLQAFLEDRPIQARRLSTAAVVWRWCRRNRGMAALAASTFVAFVGAGITGWVAYGITDEARARAEQSASEARAASAEALAQAKNAAQQSARAERNLKDALAMSSEVFDALVGPDPALALEEDEETGEQTVVVRTVVAPRDVELLQTMLAFYGKFAEQNVGNQALQLETARANRRVGAIRARLGEPEDLAAAAAAYEQAITGLKQVTDRDVRRELAAVKVDLGKLEQRRYRPREAERLFLDALDTLPPVPTSGGKGLRLERANVNLLLAQAMLPRRPTGARPGGRSFGGPGGGPVGGRAPFGGGGMSLDRERSRQARDHLQQAVALVDGLLAEEADNTEYRVMKARTLLLTARLHDRRFDGDRDRNQRIQWFDSGIGTLREVVQAHPERDDYRFELIEALRESRVRWELEPGRLRGDRERPPERGPDRSPDRERSVGDEELAVLREAKQHVERLLQDQPSVQEYRTLAAQVGGELGDALRNVPTGIAETARAARLQEAESVLVATMVALHESAGGQGASEPRLLLHVSGLQRVLADVYLAMGRRDDELTVLREARRTTERLLRDAPQIPELRAAVAGVALDFTESLRNVPTGASEAERTSRLQEAESVLVGVLSTLSEAAASPGAADPRLLQQWLELRRMLAGTYLALGQRDDAVAQVQTVFDGIERLMAAWPKGDAQGVRRMVEAVESRLLMPFERLCDRLASPALQQRLAALRAALRERGGPR